MSTRRPTSVAAAIAALVVGALGAACSVGGGGPATVTPTDRASTLPEPANGACPTSQPESLPAGETRLVTIDTAKGSIEITVESDLSPVAVGNFVALASCGFYDGVVFHRAASLQDGTPFVIQGGDPTGTGTGGPGYQIEDEPVTTPYARGTVAMARTAEPDSVGSQFFIVLDDAAADVLAAYNTYQIIGTVTDGMEAADAIYEAADAESPSDPIVMDRVSVATP
jgi:cyclophilin family peptidyl-prolyl cis-trans isomerase